MFLNVIVKSRRTTERSRMPTSVSQRSYTTLCPEKRDQQYFGRNFDRFRQLFIIFGMNHPDDPLAEKL